MRLKTGRRESKAAPIMRKGRPSPSEYIASSRAPWPAEPEVRAKLMVPPRKATMQGVQASEKTIPMTSPVLLVIFEII